MELCKSSPVISCKYRVLDDLLSRSNPRVRFGASRHLGDQIEVRRMIWAESTDENSSKKPRPAARLWRGAQWGPTLLPFAGANGATSTRRVSLRATRTPAA